MTGLPLSSIVPLSRRRMFAAVASGLAAPATLRAQGGVRLRLGVDPGGAVGAEVLGPHAVALARRVERLTNGAVEVVLHPLALLGGAGLGAVQAGQLDAVLGSADAWLSADRAFGFFARVPMGFLPGEYEAWVLHGSGREAMAALGASQGVVMQPAGDAGPRIAGWFAQLLQGPAPFDGLEIGADGLGAAVLPALGANVTGWERARDGADADGPAAGATLSQRFKVAATPAIFSPQQAISLVLSPDAVAIDTLAAAALAEAEALAAPRMISAIVPHGTCPIPAEVLAPLAPTLWHALGDLTAGRGALPFLFDDYMAGLRDISGWTAVGEGAFSDARARALEG